MAGGHRSCPLYVCLADKLTSAHVNMKISLKNALPYISRNADIVRALDLSRSQIPLEEAAELEKVK